MPLVAHNDLPTFLHLRERGEEILTVERAKHQDIRELHIGLLNMMPDAALVATEQQFIRLVGNCNQIPQFYVYPFFIPQLNRGSKARRHIGKYYFDISPVKPRRSRPNFWHKRKKPTASQTIGWAWSTS